MTTKCIQQPAPGYADRIFTSSLVAWPGVTHIAGHDYAPVIEVALADRHGGGRSEGHGAGRVSRQPTAPENEPGRLLAEAPRLFFRG